MGKANANQPATKADLNSFESKLRSEMQGVKSELKADINRLDDRVKGLDDRVKGLDDRVKGLSGEILKNSFKIDRLTDRLNTEFATKGDINRVFNLLDAIAGDIKSCQRKDALRGEAVMRREKQLAGHETRITLLEEKK
ncbi:MAG: hypothetical protein HY796_01665 [Elusimicrobia bacterium]|nr:hypothetical protein [Elusimicrobiota bacterium]